MDKITRDEEVSGIIGKIGDYEGSGYEVPGFWVMSNDNKKIGFVMYDKKSNNFVEGNSIYHYTYNGKTENDNRILQLVKDNLS